MTIFDRAFGAAILMVILCITVAVALCVRGLW